MGWSLRVTTDAASSAACPVSDGLQGRSQEPVMRPGTPDTGVERSQSNLADTEAYCESPGEASPRLQSDLIADLDAEWASSDEPDKLRETLNLGAEKSITRIGGPEQLPPEGQEDTRSEASQSSSAGTVIDRTSGQPHAPVDKFGSGVPGDGQQDVGGPSDGEQQEACEAPMSVFSSAGPSADRSTAERSSLQCSTCRVTATSEEQLASHLEGKRHRRFVAMAELEGNQRSNSSPAALSREDLHCDLCDVTAPTPQHREYHLRGQKHQRREKQQWLMEAAAAVASSSVSALLADDSSSCGDEASEASAGSIAARAASPGRPEPRPASPDAMRSPFEVFDASRPLPPAFVPGLHQRASSKVVRFSGNLQSCNELHADEPAEARASPVAASSFSRLLSSGSFKLVSGGSFSSPAAHFCPVCGIIATSEANLEDHLRGRRHARRLQYLSHMPEEDRQDQLQRTLTGGSGVFRQGSLVLPSSMDLTAYIGRVAQVQPGTPSAAALERVASLSRNKSLGSQQLSWDSTNGLHLRMDNAGGQQQPGPEAAAHSDTDGSETEAAEGRPAEDRVPKVQPRCEVCGITTTSQAHMEAHLAGRKHRRRVESAGGRGPSQQTAHYCSLCDISTTSAAHLSLHLVGRAHRRRQKAIEDGDFPLPLSETAARAAAAHAAAAAGRPSDLGSDEGGAATGGPGAEGLGYQEALRDPGSTGEAKGTSHHGLRDAVGAQPNFAARRRDRQSHPEAYYGGPAGRAQQTLLPVPWQQAMRPLPHHQGPVPQPGQPHLPVNMVPMPPFYPPGSMSPFLPGPGPHPPPMYSWWQQPMMRPLPGNPRAGFPQSAPMQYAGAFTAAHMPYGMGVAQPAPYGSGMMLPMASQPGFARRAEGGVGGPSGRAWRPPQEAYNCEVCNVQTEKLDDLKQHLRGKQHLRKLHSSADRQQ